MSERHPSQPASSFWSDFFAFRRLVILPLLISGFRILLIVLLPAVAIVTGILIYRRATIDHRWIVPVIALSALGVFVAIFLALLARVFFELWLVIFRINETATELRNDVLAVPTDPADAL